MSRYIPLKVPLVASGPHRWGIWDDLWRDYCRLPEDGELELLRFPAEAEAVEWIEHCEAVNISREHPDFLIWRSFQDGKPRGWYASRRPVPTPEEIEAGVVPNYSAKTAEGLRALLRGDDDAPQGLWI